MHELADFRSDEFAPKLPDSCQIQPSCYGFELAHWLALELNARGVVTGYPQNSDDWSWSLEYSAPCGAEFSLHCTSMEEPGATWRIAVKRYARKLFGRDAPQWSAASPLLSQLRELLEQEAAIHDLQWHELNGRTHR